MNEVVHRVSSAKIPITPKTEKSNEYVARPIPHTNHKDLVSDEFWQAIPQFSEVSETTFQDHLWQLKNTVTRYEKLQDMIKDIVSPDIMDDITQGFKKAPMSIRVSPYIFSMINWNSPYDDPIRKQFIPFGSQTLDDHPKLTFDSLGEQRDSPTAGLTHRYADKALFLALDTCPVYCRFCTRSYAVGLDTQVNEKVNFRPNQNRWQEAFAYIASRPELEDIVVSGGDVYQLKASQITEIGETLLAMPNIRRIRFATKGPVVMPQKIITDHEWRDALVRVVEKGRKMHKEVVLHTHFNHPKEITETTKIAMDMLMERGVIVRNQSVLQRGVNDDVATMKLLVKRLSYLNVTPYYVYVHDLVKGVEDLRTSVQTALHIEKHVRGVTAGFNTPTFVVDAPGGGGKRDAHSYEHYDRETGVSVYTSPSVSEGTPYLYFDPMSSLSEEMAKNWLDPATQEVMINDALTQAGF